MHELPFTNRVPLTGQITVGGVLSPTVTVPIAEKMVAQPGEPRRTRYAVVVVRFENDCVLVLFTIAVLVTKPFVERSQPMMVPE